MVVIDCRVMVLVALLLSLLLLPLLSVNTTRSQKYDVGVVYEKVFADKNGGIYNVYGDLSFVDIWCEIQR